MYDGIVKAMLPKLPPISREDIFRFCRARIFLPYKNGKYPMNLLGNSSLKMMHAFTETLLLRTNEQMYVVWHNHIFRKPKITPFIIGTYHFLCDLGCFRMRKIRYTVLGYCRYKEQRSILSLMCP
jgi:hypothetical protein